MLRVKGSRFLWAAGVTRGSQLAWPVRSTSGLVDLGVSRNLGSRGEGVRETRSVPPGPVNWGQPAGPCVLSAAGTFENTDSNRGFKMTSGRVGLTSWGILLPYAIVGTRLHTHTPAGTEIGTGTAPSHHWVGPLQSTPPPGAASPGDAEGSKAPGGRRRRLRF